MLSLVTVTLMAPWPAVFGSEAVLRCEWRVRVGRAGQAWLEMTLSNTGPRTLRVLEWGTPFEGAWLQPFVDLSLDGVALAYRGAMVKRGDPTPEEYLVLPAGQARRARIDLAQAFDLTRPGLYRVEPRLQLHDVIRGWSPRSRTQAGFDAMALHCPAVEFRR